MGGGRDFPHLSTPALIPTQPPVQWEPGLSRGLMRKGRGVAHLPASSAEVKERVVLYLYSPSGPSWDCYRVNFINSLRTCFDCSRGHHQGNK
jgi:hypothetical protein